jgi:hypothetical protein
MATINWTDEHGYLAVIRDLSTEVRRLGALVPSNAIAPRQTRRQVMTWDNPYGKDYRKQASVDIELPAIQYDMPRMRKVYVVDPETGDIRRTFSEPYDIEVFEADQNI